MTYVWYVLGLVAWAALFGCSAGSNGGDLVVDHRAQESHGCPYLQLAMGYERHGLAALGTEDQLPAFEAFSALTKDRAGLLSVYNSDPNTVPKVGQTPIRGVRLKSARTCVEDGDSNLLTLDATFEMQERPQPQRKPIEGAPACNSAIVQENLAGLWTLQITLCYDEMVLTRKTLNLIMTSVGEGILTVATSTRATSTDDFPMGTWTEEKRLHFTEWAFPQKHNGPDNVQAVIHPAAPPILTITKVDDILQEALS